MQGVPAGGGGRGGRVLDRERGGRKRKKGDIDKWKGERNYVCV